jgi:sugar phosphate isomerase/epimerase
MWWGYGAKGFNQMVQDLGMSLICSHCNIASDFEKKLDEAAMIGMNYLLCPWIGKQKTIDDYKRIADDFNNKGKLAQAAGLKFGYHNHDYSFRLQDGIFPQDILMSNTDKDLVEYEMDIYWVAAAGQDPEQWLKKYPGRFRLCHIKDRSKNPGSDNGKNSTDLGKGSIDFKSVLRTAGKNEMKHYFVEQEFYPYGSSLEAAKSNASYLETLRF